MAFISAKVTGPRAPIPFASGALLLGLLLVQPSSPSAAQSIDCGKAGGAIESALCASPDLKAQDAALGESYGRLIAAAQARQGGLANELRDGQRQWLRQRDMSCTPFAANPARLASCLAASYRTRLAYLAMAAALPSDTLPPAPATAVSRLGN